MSATLKVRHEAIGVEVRPAGLSPVLRRAIPGRSRSGASGPARAE